MVNQTKKKLDLKKIDLKENYVSMILGLIVVLVIGNMIFRAISGGPKNGSVNEASESTKSAGEGKTDLGKTSLPATHKVGQKESLWKISEKYYGSGYNWVDIVEANKIKNPDRVEPGTELKIPDVKPRPAIEAQKTQVPKAPKVESYTVQKGDTLFKIAVKVYGDGYQWTKIVQANNIRNANRIEAGQKLVIPK